MKYELYEYINIQPFSVHKKMIINLLSVTQLQYVHIIIQNKQ